MALNTAGLTLAANGLNVAGGIKYLAIHTATPDAAGSNQSAAARQAVTWTITNGDLSASNIAFTGGAASGAAPVVGYWSASTGGTFYGYKALTGDTTFNAAGELTITSITIDLASS